tara:strand:- start:174 stop:803 length:630 start_codon:yes stop_codon:yes gene_type:complete
MKNLTTSEKIYAFFSLMMIAALVNDLVSSNSQLQTVGEKLFAVLFVIILPGIVAKYLMDNGKSFFKWLLIGVFSGGVISGIYALNVFMKQSKKANEESIKRKKYDSMSFKEKVEDFDYKLSEDEQKKLDAVIKREETLNKKKKQKEGKEKREFNTRIVNFLKKEGQKLPASDIDFRLKIKDIDKVKEACEEMYRSGRIGRTANYRYFKD